MENKIVDCSTPEKANAYIKELAAAKGKNFSANNSEGKRRAADSYQTPYSLTRLYIESLKQSRRLLPEHNWLEPAAGSGAIVKVLRENGIEPTHYDVETDFLKETRQFPCIITNPPYSLSMEFIQQAMRVASEEFSFLFPLSYLQGNERYVRLWSKRSGFRLESVSVITRFSHLGDDVLWEDGCHRTGMIAYAWFHWVHGYRSETALRHLDINPYILSVAEYRRRITAHYLAQGLDQSQIDAILAADKLSKRKAKEAA